MFDKRHRGVTYFGSWAEDTAHIYGCRDAFAIVEAAAARCLDEDVRRDADLIAALAYLSQHVGRTWPVAFWRSLGMVQQTARWQSANAALNGIGRRLPRDTR